MLFDMVETLKEEIRQLKMEKEVGKPSATSSVHSDTSEEESNSEPPTVSAGFQKNTPEQGWQTVTAKGK